MGTTYLVQVSDPLSESERIAVSRAVQETLAEVNSAMSTYVADSEVSRFNRAAAGVAIPLSIPGFEVFSEAERVSELTGGAFDVSVAPLVRLWGFGAGASTEPQVPSDEAVAAARALVGFHHVRLSDDPLSVTKDEDGVECDLSAIAKGYGVDLVSEELSRRGWKNFMVEVGGEVRTSGKNATGEAWRIGIEKPLPGTRALQRTLPLSGLSLATSGDYRNFYEEDGKLYSHLIDPREEDRCRMPWRRLASWRTPVCEPTRWHPGFWCWDRRKVTSSRFERTSRCCSLSATMTAASKSVPRRRSKRCFF